jgi:methyl-accepting chemotaxis protein
MALGFAIILSGVLLTGLQSFTIKALGPVLFPMGSALLPHVVGVWMGHELASRHQDGIEAIEESVFKRLAEDADATREVIQELYRRREELLKQQTESLKEQTRLFSDIKERLTEAMNLTTRPLEDFVKTTNNMSKDIGRGLGALNKAVEGILTQVQTLKEELQASASGAKTFHTNIQDTSRVIKDLNKLHKAIVELLSSDLFRSSGIRT